MVGDDDDDDDGAAAAMTVVVSASALSFLLLDAAAEAMEENGGDSAQSIPARIGMSRPSLFFFWSPRKKASGDVKRREGCKKSHFFSAPSVFF